VYGINGKPELEGHPLHFNVSHSEDSAVFAFSRSAPVGVDLECVRQVPDMLQIAQRFFTPAEALALSDVPDRERTEAFFRIWTRKKHLSKRRVKGCPARSKALTSRWVNRHQY
jgi:4'-phosphopantetheinyl transferase